MRKPIPLIMHMLTISGNGGGLHFLFVSKMEKCRKVDRLDIWLIFEGWWTFPPPSKHGPLPNWSLPSESRVTETGKKGTKILTEVTEFEGHPDFMVPARTKKQKVNVRRLEISPLCLESNFFRTIFFEEGSKNSVGKFSAKKELKSGFFSDCFNFHRTIGTGRVQNSLSPYLVTIQTTNVWKSR